MIEDELEAFWRPTPPEYVGVSVDLAEGATVVAWGVRDGVMHILDVYEVEAASDVAPDFTGSRSFRPRFLPQAHRASWWSPIIGAAIAFLCAVALAVILLWIVVSTIRSHL